MELFPKGHRSNPNLRPGVVAAWPYPDGASRKHGELSKTYRRLFGHVYPEQVDNGHVRLSAVEMVSYDRLLSNIGKKLWEMRRRALRVFQRKDTHEKRSSPRPHTTQFERALPQDSLAGGLSSSSNTVHLSYESPLSTEAYVNCLIEAMQSDLHQEVLFETLWEQQEQPRHGSATTPLNPKAVATAEALWESSEDLPLTSSRRLAHPQAQQIAEDLWESA